MKIEILPEIVGELNDTVAQGLYETIEVLYEEFGTVPEHNSKIKVDLFDFVFEYTLFDKLYEFNSTTQTLNIILLFKQTGYYEN